MAVPVRHYWNRSWGRLTRRDIRVYATEAGFRVEWSGEEGKVGGSRQVTTEPEAVMVVDDLIRQAGGEWKDITDPGRPDHSGQPSFPTR